MSFLACFPVSSCCWNIFLFLVICFQNSLKPLKQARGYLSDYASFWAPQHGGDKLLSLLHSQFQLSQGNCYLCLQSFSKYIALQELLAFITIRFFLQLLAELRNKIVLSQLSLEQQAEMMSQSSLSCLNLLLFKMLMGLSSFFFQ